MIKQAKEKKSFFFLKKKNKKQKTTVCYNSTLNPYLFLLGISPANN